jgi:hypothetical protein
LLHAKLTSEEPGATVRRLATSAAPPREIVTELYLACYGRFPLEEELVLAIAPFGEDPSDHARRQQAVEDVLWALLNSAEFVFNH